MNLAECSSDPLTAALSRLAVNNCCSAAASGTRAHLLASPPTIAMVLQKTLQNPWISPWKESRARGTGTTHHPPFSLSRARGGHRGRKPRFSIALSVARLPVSFPSPPPCLPRRLPMRTPVPGPSCHVGRIQCDCHALLAGSELTRHVVAFSCRRLKPGDGREGQAGPGPPFG
jgi:hypothetical protein